jgi:hypothetical protein
MSDQDASVNPPAAGADVSEDECENRNERVLSEAASLSLENGGAWVPIIVERADGSSQTASVRARSEGGGGVVISLEVR